MVKVSVIIPVYNRKKMLRRAMLSVLEQDFDNFELLVVDDGSHVNLDEERALLGEKGKWISHKTNKGVSAARNSALNEARGEWIALLDSDDKWLPHKLRVQLAYHEKHPEYLFSQTLEDWYRNNKKVNKMKKHEQPCGDAFEKSLSLCCISSSSVLLKRSLYDEFGMYDEGMRVCEDYDFWLRVTSRYEIGLVPEILVEKFGGHDSQLSKSEVAMDRFRVYALVKLLEYETLSDIQKELVLKEIGLKAGILEKGALKRGLVKEAELYRLLQGSASSVKDYKERVYALL